MATKRKIEIFSAGCDFCDEAVSLAKNMVCPLCEITVSDMKTGDVAERAKVLGIRLVPAVVIDGRLVECCTGRGIDEASLRGCWDRTDALRFLSWEAAQFHNAQPTNGAASISGLMQTGAASAAKHTS